MAKYCIHCGKKLEDGEVCDCTANAVKSQSNNLGTSLLEVLKGIFVKPIDTIKKYTDESNFNLALILLGIFSLAISLFVLSLIKNLSEVTSSMGALTLYTIGMSSIQIPYMKIFFVVLIVSIAFIFAYTGLLYLVNSIMFKGIRSFKKVFTMYGISSVITTVSLLVSTIFMFIHPALGFIIFLLGSTLTMLYVFKGIEFLGVKITSFLLLSILFLLNSSKQSRVFLQPFLTKVVAIFKT